MDASANSGAGRDSRGSRDISLLATSEAALAGTRRRRRGARASLALLPRLQRWASGRLPMRARSLLDTTDLVRETLLRTLQGIDQVGCAGQRFQPMFARPSSTV
ncbi:MAG: hypothetical protein IPH86_19500 [bacterium]|nr:hypothetical protein [bacterium]